MDVFFDPLRRREVPATPEEKVRQWFIGVLSRNFAVPMHMMMSEVGFTFGRKQYRSDIVVYGRNAHPLMVVECKREEVPLTEEVLLQAMRYNMVLDVRFLVVTNGKNTYLYHREGKRFLPMDSMPTYEQMLCQQ